MNDKQEPTQWTGSKMTRRKLLSSLGLAGAAVAAGTSLGSPVFGATVTEQVYGQQLPPSTAQPAAADARAAAHVLLIDPAKWGISTDGTNSRATTDGLNAALADAKSKGFGEVYLPKGKYLIDAVCKTNHSPEIGGGIRVPSNLKLTLDSEAELKVEPNGSYGYSCIFLDNVHNVTITGGIVTGDRNEHDYSNKTKPTHEWGFGINVRGGTNITIDNVRIKDCSGDCIYVNAIGMINYGTVPYTPPQKVMIQNCTLDGSRRNNISISACDGVVIRNNLILNAGIQTDAGPGFKSKIGPGFGIDIEGYGEGDIDYETPLNIVIQGNQFRGNRVYSVGNFNGYGVVIEGNFADNTLSYGNGTDTVIANNVLIRTDRQRTGIDGQGVSQGLEANHVTIMGNIVKGFGSGMDIRGKDVVVTGNALSHLGEAGVGIAAFAAENVWIANNSVHRTKGTPYRIASCKDVQLVNNKAHGSDKTAIEANASSQVILRGNVVRDCSGGIKVTNISSEASNSEVVVESNHIDLTEYKGKTAYAISFDSKSEVTLKGNRIPGPRNTAIYGEGGIGKRAKIADNEIADANSFTAMIQIVGGAKHEIVGNNVTFNKSSNGGVGIYLKDAKDSIVAKNTVYSNSEYALTHSIATKESTGTKVLNNIVMKGALSLNEKTDLNAGNTVV
ncbi:hypothetical protein AV654_26700 [Paenibacillus elgii]|uniref:Right handed beta helix domain-containing protein n=1 Tax=Paenibacillus elgii TaxID=189691 RepID=A0A163VT74_9BACL|nr:right-handed parallel beta-helix repeat-containing protein [Paenibacillus elgii]KZE75360.1 hypothetical protein AV654_26700 [Paenibacillus elgii]